MKGITSMSVKDVVTSLVDDGLVDTEKIGTSVYFWAFPSKASQARKRKLEMAEEKSVKMAKRLEELEKEVAAAEKGREETAERQELMERLKEEKDKRDKMLVRLKDFAENDPIVLEQMVRETGEAVEAVNRWTDNIFSIQGWIKKKFPSVDQASFSKQFGIPEDLDYLE
eukprot:TRINITY_DN4708_c0_g1_i1.p1 TRINITY_DN4708_c0_g1~~TRINITY_DN4708_c0_g1_i1.p1  ORF type:complete len:169 (-),score=79.02 TRINITY_DN4708_c0_g1_i1:153-659(-)